MADTKHHDINPPPRGTNEKRAPAAPGAGPKPTTFSIGNTSPVKTTRKATDHK